MRRRSITDNPEVTIIILCSCNNRKVNKTKKKRRIVYILRKETHIIILDKPLGIHSSARIYCNMDVRFGIQLSQIVPNGTNLGPFKIWFLFG